jgi:hypothetical protein
MLVGQIHLGGPNEDQEIFPDYVIFRGGDNCASVWHFAQMVRSDFFKRH